MFAGSCDEIDGKRDESDEKYLFQLIDLYKLGLDHKLYRLQNEIMDRIGARRTRDVGYFACSLVAKVYSITVPNAKIRKNPRILD